MLIRIIFEYDLDHCAQCEAVIALWSMKSILVIEDNLELRENTAELLELEGYKVFTASNGQIGFEETRKNFPDVIVCDMMMPVTDGIEFLKLMKEERATSCIPLIFFSAGAVPRWLQSDLEKGRDLFLKKPFTDTELLNAVAISLPA